jgi:hypothetical protein
MVCRDGSGVGRDLHGSGPRHDRIPEIRGNRLIVTATLAEYVRDVRRRARCGARRDSHRDVKRS